MCNYRLQGFCRRFAPEYGEQSEQRSDGVSAAEFRRRRTGLSGAQKWPWRYMQFLGNDFGFSSHYLAAKLYDAGLRPKTFTNIRENLLERLVK